MKILFCCLFILLLVGCSSTKVSNLQKTPAGEEWKVPDNEAPEILARLNKCGCFKRCRESAIVEKNNSVYQYVIKKYGKENVMEVAARYRHADQKNYAKLWGLNPKSDTTKVKGYRTYILKVTTSDKSTATYYYYYVKLCPPPSNCPNP
jgi:hypothetical protein